MKATSFKMFAAYPGVFPRDDATIFRESAAGACGGLICMHAENGIVINEITKHAFQRSHRAEISSAHAAHGCRRKELICHCDCGN